MEWGGWGSLLAKDCGGQSGRTEIFSGRAQGWEGGSVPSSQCKEGVLRALLLFPAGRICRRGGGFQGRGWQIGNHLRRFGSLF